MPAPLPIDEAARLESLHACRILDTPPEPAFERIVRLASATLRVPVALVSFVDRDRQWYKARVGLTAREGPRAVSFCAHAILGRDVLVVPDAAADERFAANPHVVGKPGYRFYAGAPLIAPDGHALGTLCVLDYHPRAFDERERGILAGLAAVVVDELVLRRAAAEPPAAPRAGELTRVNRALRSEVRQRRLADDQCRAGERRFRQLFNQAGDAAMVHDVEGRLVDVNEAACAMLGYTRDELLTMNVRDFAVDHVPSGGLPLWRELPAGSMEKFECLDRRKNGELFTVEVQITVLDMAEGRHLLALIRDITERKRTEEFLRARVRQQEAVARLGTRALSGGGVDALLREAVALVGDTLGIDMCRVYEHRPEQGNFAVSASLQSGDQVVGLRVATDCPTSLAGHVLHTRQPAIVEDVATESRFEIPESLHALGVKSALCVVIGGSNPGDPCFGLLGAGNRQRRGFNEDDVFFVQSVANVLAAAIVRRQQETDLRQTEERFRLAILDAPFPIMLHASDGEVLQLNHAWTRLTGYRAEDLRTTEDWIIRANPSEEARAEVRASLVDFEGHDGILERPGRRVRCADGSERRWDFTRANLDRLPDGRCLRISTAVDVTERHQGEAALRAARDEAEKANRAKSAFLSRMSHELRTPLNAILGFGQLLEFSALDKQDALSLSYILKGGRHLLALIDEVLDLSRAETGDLRLVRGDVNVAALAQECVELVARLAQARGIVCRVDVPATASLWADEQRLRQTLLNLLSNAIKYNRPGGEVLVSSEETPPGSLRLKVSDTGPGISAAGMERLFVPFERLEQEYGETEGTGLGLVISRRIAEAMGGTLGVESEPGRGSTFWIELPLASGPAAPVPAIRPPEPVAAAAALPPEATLLYIEDNLSNLQVVKALLANCRPRWQFLSAQDGREGLEQARRARPDLVLLDLHLPGMKGDAVLAELRRDPRTREIPVVMLSADATMQTRERLLAGGAHDYISKPFKVDHVLNLLDRTLSQAGVSQQN